LFNFGQLSSTLDNFSRGVVLSVGFVILIDQNSQCAQHALSASKDRRLEQDPRSMRQFIPLYNPNSCRKPIADSHSYHKRVTISATLFGHCRATQETGPPNSPQPAANPNNLGRSPQASWECHPEHICYERQGWVSLFEPVVHFPGMVGLNDSRVADNNAVKTGYIIRHFSAQ